MKIANVAAVNHGATLAGTPNTTEAALKRASTQLEGVFLRQLLENSGMGKQAGQGYGPMIVDALASAVSDAGGLGLAQSIALALAPVHAQKTNK